MPDDRPPFFGLLQRRACLCPTWRGWLLAALIVLPLVVTGLRRLQPFLAVTAPVTSTVLVVEGWMPDYGLKEVIAETHRTPYVTLVVTGGPLERGAPLSNFGTYADLGAATLDKLGVTTPHPQAVPATDVYRDRTFTSALALRDWLKARGPIPEKINLVSLGTHARRSRLLFNKVFGPDVEIGIIAVPDRGYDAQHWWRSSQGFRSVTDEFIGYLYARFIF
ncbi:MAG: hypothetical protein WC661_02990 [Opitutaceae bacterium]|jgi:hypothetical protein